MKQLISLSLASLAALALVGCSSSAPASSVAPAASAPSAVSSEPTEAPVGMPNPITECASSDEVNQAVGCQIAQLPVMGVTDHRFSVIDCGSHKMGQYEFTFMGADWCYRAAPTEEDISGVYLNDGSLLSERCASGETYADADCLYTRWFDGNMQYSLYAAPSASLTAEQFASAIGDFRSLQASGSAGQAGDIATDDRWDVNNGTFEAIIECDPNYNIPSVELYVAHVYDVNHIIGMNPGDQIESEINLNFVTVEDVKVEDDGKIKVNGGDPATGGLSFQIIKGTMDCVALDDWGYPIRTMVDKFPADFADDVVMHEDVFTPGTTNTHNGSHEVLSFFHDLMGIYPFTVRIENGKIVELNSGHLV